MRPLDTLLVLIVLCIGAALAAAAPSGESDVDVFVTRVEDGLIDIPDDTRWVFVRGEEYLFARDKRGFTRATRKGPGWMRYRTSDVDSDPAYALKPYHYVHVADRDNARILPVNPAWFD